MVHALLTERAVRLVTLSGPGGIGKTRLGIEVARGLSELFPDGIAFVDLSPLNDPARVVPAIANAVGVQAVGARSFLQQVQDTLRIQRSLLLIDNFEHLMPAAPELAALLGATEELKLLVTSRVPLQLSWEHAVLLPSLSLPPAHDGSGAETDASEAIALFVDRARATNASFVPTPDDLDAIAGMCRRLDGLPLAIELSAARTRLLPPRMLLERIDNSLDVLTGGLRDVPARQQTLRRTLEWSYRLLTPREQRFFALLAVFAGRFTFDAVTSVAADDALPSEELVQTMITHNLLAGPERYQDEFVFRMLYTIRAFARECLATDPSAHELHRRHAGHYLDLVERAELEISGADALPWLQRLALAYDNLRAAFEWLLLHDRSGALRLAGALRRRFWTFRGDLSEGRRWLKLAFAAPVDLAPAIRAKAFLAAADLAFGQTDFPEAIEFYERSLELWEAIDDQSNAARVRNNLGDCYRARGDLDNAAQLFERNRRLWRTAGDTAKEAKAVANLAVVKLAAGDYAAADELFSTSLVMFRRLDDELNIARMLNNRAYALVMQARYGEADPILQDSLARFGALNDKRGRADTLNNLAAVALGTGDSTRATASALESLELFETLGDRNGMAECLEHLSGIAAIQRQHERGAQLLAAATALRATLGATLSAGERARIDALQNRLRRVLGNKRFATAWLLGEALSNADALALARAEPEPRVDDTPSEPQPATPRAPNHIAVKSANLSSREREVLALLAGGLTYEQIADRLVISPRTVNRHLTSIYGKLNVETRHAASRWAIDNQLI